MKFCLRLLLIFAVALLWNACSDSSGSGETIEMTVAANVEVVKDKKSLPSCTSDLQGQEYYVTSENAIYACIDKAWVMTSKVKEWETYASMVCTTKPLKDNSGVQVLCGDSLVAKIYNGEKGKTGVKGEKGEVGENGADGADGAKGDQGDKGEPGEKGVAGKDGENGTNGKKGAPGEDCSVETLLEDDSTGVPVPRGLTITCGSTVRDIYNGSDGVDGEDGSNGENGEPGSDCYVREIDGGIEQYCDGNFVNTVYNGRTGENGSNGDDGMSCHLETMEVMGLRVICGEDSIGTLFSAINGVNGKNGVDGTSCYAVENEDGSGYTIICGGNFATAGYEKPSWYFLNPDVEYGTFVDSRDNQIYKMVKIGSQVWMAENLNYADSVNYPSMKKRSRCYVDNADSCAKYGRYYSWAAAMDSLNTGCGYGKNCSPTFPVQGVCPNGWHLPTKAEYETLVEAVDGRGNMLKSMNAGWPEASDDYGFSVTPTSGFDVTGEPHPDYWGVDANVWSATQSSKTGAYYLYFVDYRNAAELWDGDGEKNIARSVRCLKDDSQMTTVVQLTNGKNGKNGTNGIDGKNCSIEKNDYGYTFACGGDYVGTVTEKPSWQFLNPEYEYAMFVDGRDNQVYKATKIGSQVWMAENLNYADSVNYQSMKKRSRCYADDVDSCAKYGRYYTWSAAMDSLNTGCGFGKKCSPTYPVQGVCPNGWHLPAKAEYETLIEFVDGHGNRLKSKNAGWPEASDDYGFSVAPTGTASMNGGFNYFGTDVNMNTASPSSEPGPYFLYLVDYRNVVEIWDGYDEDYEKDIARPVRCLKDDSSMETMYQMTNGSDGKDGKNGTDGGNCTIAEKADGSGYTITCPSMSGELLNGSDGKNGSSCVTEPTADGSKLKVMCPKESGGVIVYDSVGVITNAAEGTYCAMVPVWNAPKDSRLMCGLKKGDPKPEYAKIPWSYMNPLIKYDVFIDERDGQPYRSVTIGTQVWMAENLNYADSVKTPSLKNRSWCYNNSLDYCKTRGRLYTWAAAIDSVKLYDNGEGIICGDGKTCTLPERVQGICPEGWHLPSRGEWETLYAAMGKQESSMQSMNYSEWYYAKDKYGFSAVPGGYASSGGFGNGESVAYIWSSTESTDRGASLWRLAFNSAYIQGDDKNEGFSVRCVQD